MISLTYFSTATLPFTAPQLDSMLATVRPRNERLDITGLLLYAGGHFIQTLEGPDKSVDATFARIERDSRHRNVIVALREEITSRAFPDWSMGYDAINSEAAATIPGYSDYLQGEPSTDPDIRHYGYAGVFHRVFRENRH